MKVLRPYQNEAINKALQSTEGIICMATGLGKTITAVELSRSFSSTLFIVDSEELAEQATDAFRSVYPETGLIKADVFNIKPITIASAQTLHRRLHKLSPDQFQLQVVDEAHLYMAATFRKGVEFFSPKLRIGITATPERMDNLPLWDLFGDIVFDYGIREGIRNGYLVELDARRLKTTVSLDSVGTVAGEFNQGQLSNAIDTLSRNNQIVDDYIANNNGERAIAFCCSIEHAVHLCEAFQMKGVKATAISSDEDKTGDRTQKVSDFREGKYDVICNVNILTKGFDCVEVSCIINAAPTKSRTRYLQGIGRGTRPLKGVIDGLETAAERISAIRASNKKRTIIIDVTDNTTRHNVVNAHELDKLLHPDERVFITDENRQKLLESRLNKKAILDFTRDNDETVSLLSIPKIKINFDSEGMKKPATEAQILWIEKLGYKSDENVYTHGMINQIVGDLPASRDKIEFAKSQGYDVSGRLITNNDINAIQIELWIKRQKKIKK